MSTGNRRRLFFALWPDAPTRERLCRESRQAVADSGGHPVPPENLHITLAFLGNVSGELVDALVAIRPDVDAPKTVRLTRYGYWPGPAVLWAGPRSSRTDLAGVVDVLWQCVGDLGISRDRRSFRPHVTLARKARQRPLNPAPLRVDWLVSEFVLVESVAGQRPLYRVLAHYAFKGSPPCD